MKGFARAQAKYDAMIPEEGPEISWSKHIHLEESTTAIFRNRQVVGKRRVDWADASKGYEEYTYTHQDCVGHRCPCCGRFLPTEPSEEWGDYDGGESVSWDFDCRGCGDVHTVTAYLDVGGDERDDYDDY
jgi:hypothetical protein